MLASTLRRGTRVWLVAMAMLAGFGVLAALGLPARAQSTSSVVSISVPVAQVLEGTTVSAVPAGSSAAGRLTVKSNVPWVLLVDVETGAPALVTWSEDPLWQPLPSHGVALRGPKGIHHFAYRLRTAPAATLHAVVRFSLTPSQ